MATAALDSLPEELQFHILQHLDAPPPSSQRLRQEPSLGLTSSDEVTLKSISVISKRWRRLVLPILFKHARFRLDAPPNPHWDGCYVCNEAAMSGSTTSTPQDHQRDRVDQYHIDMVAAALERCNVNLRAGQTDDEAQQMGQIAFEEKERLKPSKALAWIPRFYHGLQDFLTFLEQHDLIKVVIGFVLYTDRMLEQKLHRFPHQAADRDWRFPASAAFWSHLLSTVNPGVVTIVAPPMDLACLTNCAIDTFGDWAFSDMDFHVLSLRCDSSTSSIDRAQASQSIATPSHGSLRAVPSGYPSVAPSSLFALRPWTHLNLNEGSFLKAYGTYEFFERGPPSIVTSIEDCIMQTISPARLSVPMLTSLKSFDYTAIFPFSNHANFQLLLHQVEELNLQLAPEPHNRILNDKARVGKAELADCWTELMSTYGELVKPLMTAQLLDADGTSTWGTRSPDVKLKKLVSRDYRIIGVKEELDEVFVALCLPVWVEYEDGVFTRQM